MANEKTAATTSVNAKAKAKGKVEAKNGGFNLADGPEAARARMAALDLSNASTVQIRQALADICMITGINVGGA